MSDAETLFDPEPTLRRAAKISNDGLYRYGLLRDWSDDEMTPTDVVTFMMLNPSTADAENDDPTIRRCLGFTRALGGTALIVLNLYAYRATKPADLWKAADPVGPDNDRILASHIEAAAEAGRPVIAAWGANAKAERVARVLALPGAAVCMTALGVTKDGQPRHPLYLPSAARPTRWPEESP